MRHQRIIAAAFLLLPSAASGRQCASWERVFETPYPNIVNAGFGFDPTRGVLLLYGGGTGTLPMNETWEWDGARWAVRDSGAPSPPPLRTPSMRFHPMRGRMWLDGGIAPTTLPANQPRNGLWEFDPAAGWAPVAAPSAVQDGSRCTQHVLMYSHAIGQMLYYPSDQCTNSTQVFMLLPNGTVAPIPRSANSPEVVPLSNAYWIESSDMGPQTTVAWGRGRFDETFLGTFYANPSASMGVGIKWRYAPIPYPGRPAPDRMASPPVFDEARRTIVVLVWNSTSTEAQLYELALGTFTWTRIPAAEPWPLRTRRMEIGYYDPGRRAVTFIQSDADPEAGPHAWSWDGAAWTAAGTSPNTPARRLWSSVVADTLNGRLIMFGGRGNTTDAPTNTWAWNGAAWTVVGNGGPSPRYLHGMVYDAARDEVLLYGGRNTTGPLSVGETWVFREGVWTRRPNGAPGMISRRGHAMVYDAARGKTVVFGGRDSNNAPMNDTWEWNGAAWTRVAAGGPEARAYASITYDTRRGVAVLFGGTTATGSLGDTWEYSAGSWRRVATSGPAPRVYSAMAYDPSRGVCVLAGGCRSIDSNPAPVPMSDTWQWDGVSWRRLADSGFGIRFGAALVYDPVSGRPLMYGGDHAAEYGSSDGLGMPYGDLVALNRAGPPPRISTPLTDARVSPGGAIAFTATAEHAASATVTWLHNGVVIADDGRVQGQGTPTLVVSSIGLEDEGAYRVVVTSDCGSDFADASILIDRPCAADFNLDGGVDGRDIERFVAMWERADPVADVDGNGGCDGEDVAEFFRRWEAGGC